MAGPERPRPIWLRLPRWFYWTVGAAIAFVGAFVARGLSEQVPLDDRWPFWLAGTAVIFFGLWVLSFGTRSRLNNGRSRDDTDNR